MMRRMIAIAVLLLVGCKSTVGPVPDEPGRPSLDQLTTSAKVRSLQSLPIAANEVLVVYRTDDPMSIRMSEYYATKLGTTRSLGISRLAALGSWYALRPVLVQVAAEIRDHGIRAVQLMPGITHKTNATHYYSAWRYDEFLKRESWQHESVTDEERTRVAAYRDKFIKGGHADNRLLSGLNTGLVEIVNRKIKVIATGWNSGVATHWAMTTPFIRLHLALGPDPLKVWQDVTNRQPSESDELVPCLAIPSAMTSGTSEWTEADMMALVDRAASPPGLTAGGGVVYVERVIGGVRTGTHASGRARDTEIQKLRDAIEPLGMTVEMRGKDSTGNVFPGGDRAPLDKPSLAFITGFAQVDVDGGGWPTAIPPPCAIWSNMTSAGGKLPRSGQTTVVEFLDHGWTAAEGCITEPWAIWRKFPSLDVIRHMALGRCAGYALAWSVKQHYQGYQAGITIARWPKPINDPGEPIGALNDMAWSPIPSHDYGWAYAAASNAVQADVVWRKQTNAPPIGTAVWPVPDPVYKEIVVGRTVLPDGDWPGTPGYIKVDTSRILEYLTDGTTSKQAYVRSGQVTRGPLEVFVDLQVRVRNKNHEKSGPWRRTRVR